MDNDVRIWNEWPFEKYRAGIPGETIGEFVKRIKEDDAFAKKWATSVRCTGASGAPSPDANGPWTVAKVIARQTNPESRRLIVSSWHAAYVDEMALPPCHLLYQFYVNDGTISLQLYQRSADAFLGVPFNIASYSLLLMMVAHVTGLNPGEFVHTFGDAHIYKDHLEQVALQLSRESRPLPKMEIVRKVDSIDDFRFEDFKLSDYDPHRRSAPRVGMISIIVAIASNNCIGKGDALPWHYRRICAISGG